MNNSLSSQTEPTTPTAILVLPEGPDWYFENLAEVPFLLRNMLTLQRAGIRKLTLWMENSNVIADPDFEKIHKDARLQIDVERVSDSEPEFSNTNAIVLDGSSLLEKLEVMKALNASSETSTDHSGFNFFPETLKQRSDIKIISSNQASRLTSKSDLHAAEEGLLKTVGLGNDSMMDRLMSRFISRQLTRLFLKTSLTPNQITLLSLLLGLGSALCFFQGTYYSGIAGAILLLVSAWVDCTDGEIARLKFMETPWGAKLDIVCDNIVHCFVFFSIGMGLFFQTGENLYKVYGGLAVVGSLASFMIMSGIIMKKKQEAAQGITSESNLANTIANRDFIYFLLVMASIDKLDIFILLTAIGSNAFALYLIVTTFKRDQPIIQPNGQ